MKKIQNQNNDKFFGFLGDTLSISNLFTDHSKNNAEKEVREQAENRDPAKSTSDFFDLLAGSLSMYTVYA